MAKLSHSILLLAAACALAALAPKSLALIEGPGVYYGLELPEPLYNYWNYTSDIQDMHTRYERNDFAGAAQIFVSGKNNVRNATVTRNMHDFTYRNLSTEGPASWWGVYNTYFKTLTYLKDLIDPPLYGNGSYAGACCGVRAAALDVYMRLWQLAYARHEGDIGIVINIAEEASHGFAVLSSPVKQQFNYWERAEKYNIQACVPKTADPVTGKSWAATNLALRNAFAELGPAIDLEDADQRSAKIAEARAMLERAPLVQLMQVMMVEAYRTTQKFPAKRSNPCYSSCVKAGLASGVKAAWTSMQPLVARSPDTATLAKITDMLNNTPAENWDRKTYFPALAAEVEKLATSLGVNFKGEVWGACKL